MTATRRDFLVAGSSAFALTALPACAADALASGPDARAEATLSAMAEAMLVDAPESASGLGIDTGPRAALKHRLGNKSPAGQAQIAAHVTDRLSKLRAIDLAPLSPVTRTNVEVARAAHELAAEGFAFPFGDMAIMNSNWSYRNAPYAVAQNTGSFVETPDFLDSNHAIANPADADAYLDRLTAYAANLAGETHRLRHDAGIGVSAPAFLLDKSIAQMEAVRALPLDQWVPVASITRRTASMPGDYGARALQIVRDKVAPSLAAQVAELKRQRATATMNAGVWKLPEGEAYYAWALKAGTTTTMSPEEVHQLGLEQLAALQSDMDGLLKGLGMTQGTVGERMTAMGKDPRYLFPNDDTGRAQILAYIDGRLTDIRTRLPRAFATLVPAKLVVKRVPVEIEAGAPGAYAGAGSIDGTTPGNYYINLRDTSIWPRYGLPTLTYHEGIPGHIWQGEYTYKLPLIRSLLAFNAYSEGWALYAEQLGDELGAYDGDVAGRLGYLQSIAYRCCRLVVDTGLHAKRWTRDKAIHWFATTNGSTVEDVQAEVDRYCAWPGQACGYKVGHGEINRLRSMAKAALGDRFDFRLFNDAVVKGGGVPMTVLAGHVDAWVAERKRG
ncbi:MAG: DUF885 domain-containing protein [Sphingobium sp.]|uniref:DUF885 domain-containing protein n=1 Tax=Sphingobium sp. TaxID=1912891 RepID=UPI000C5D47CE|nr:DUF885 family protein [Sphingobium sp.]MBU0658155.1 DUF885 family protein [Alphaproteobacteria bacterium]MBA4755226.1 DUF885 family protein [Sphingobium sp.]MBS90352.1 DUF885 domain-containing protein [Sphingobium sp.]MBU0775352.1 DUF885 family protein [Alphaproteobacteria bacterium]TAJ76573.1 MAG: DUF885 domain-containing protein [Sphingobium sp.]